jgi:type IV secretion system protein VirB6
MPIDMLPIIGPSLAKVDTSLADFFVSAASRVAVAATTPFRILVTLYIVLWGLAMWRGLIREPMGDAVMRMMRIVLIGAIALGTGVYVPVIAPAIFNTPAELAAVVAGIPVTPVSVMDDALAKGDEIARGYMALVSVTEPGTSLAAIASALVVWIFTCAVVLYGTALVLLSKVALAILLGLGPLFIALLLFDTTKRFFESWMAQALNYLFVYVLVSTAMTVLFALWQPGLNYAIANRDAGFSSLLPMLISGGAALVVLMQVPSIASGLAGGVQIGTLGALGWASSKVGSALGASRPQNVRAAYRSVRRDVMALRAGTAMGVRAATLPARWIASRVRPGNSVRRPS